MSTDNSFDAEIAALEAAHLGTKAFEMQPDQEPPAAPAPEQRAKRVPKFPLDPVEHMALIFGKPALLLALSALAGCSAPAGPSVDDREIAVCSPVGSMPDRPWPITPVPAP